MNKNRFLNTIHVVAIILVTFSFLLQGCTNEDEAYTENDITNSIAMEEYVIAGLDYQQSLNTFNNEIRNIDFSKLKSYQDTKGNIVINIPTSVCIEEKEKIFNEKKKALLEKYPQIVSFSSKTRLNYFQKCIRNSSNINSKILELGIPINQPRLKEYIYETFDNNDYIAYLDSQISNSNYVEIVLIVFEDGTVMTFIDSTNTSTKCTYPTLSKKTNGKWYTSLRDSSAILYIAHTHRYSNLPSPEDLADKLDGLDERIYTSGGNTKKY
jgi:hypothetical protein